MKVYIAAPYPELKRAQILAGELKSSGIACCSRWLTDGFEDTTPENAKKDLDDVAAADVLIAFNPLEWGNRGTGGRHVELGYALALQKPIVLIGERTNIFHQLVVQVSFVDEAIPIIKRFCQ